MKKRLLSGMLVILSLSFVNNSFAQFKATADATNDTMRFDTSGVYTFTDTLTNTGTDTLTVSWNVDMARTFLPTNWTASACDNHICYPWGASTQRIGEIMLPDSTGNWTVDIDPTAGGLGTGWVTENLSGNGVSKVVVYILTKSTTGINSVAHVNEDVILYPNPTRNDVNIIFNENMGVRSIAICNLIGRTVSLFSITGNSAKLSVENLPSGIYFIRLMDANSNLVTTRKFTRM